MKKPIHDEWLFITVHQVYELWFKQILLELDTIIEVFYQKSVHQKSLTVILSRFKRMIKIQEVLLNQVSILETISALDFLDFRSLLYPASGMESLQFRLIENKLGLRNEDRLKIHKDSYLKIFSTKEQEILKKAEESNLFYGVEKWLERMPFLSSENFDFKTQYLEKVDQVFEREKKETKKHKSLPEKMKERNLKMIDGLKSNLMEIFDKNAYEKSRKKGKWRLSHAAIQAALMIQVYKDHHLVFYLPALLISSLLEVDKNWTLWRVKHMLMVTEMIGSRPGTGGSSGVEYLNQTPGKHKVFSDFLSLIPFLIPRSFLPPLPKPWMESHLKNGWL